MYHVNFFPVVIRKLSHLISCLSWFCLNTLIRLNNCYCQDQIKRQFYKIMNNDYDIRLIPRENNYYCNHFFLQSWKSWLKATLFHVKKNKTIEQFNRREYDREKIKLNPACRIFFLMKTSSAKKRLENMLHQTLPYR